MQLLLTKAELQLLADLLEDRRWAIARSADPSDREKRLAREYEDLLGRVIEHDIHFSADELTTLADMLNDCDREMKLVSDPRRPALDAMLDKFVEACAMV